MVGVKGLYQQRARQGTGAAGSLGRVCLCTRECVCVFTTKPPMWFPRGELS